MNVKRQASNGGPAFPVETRSTVDVESGDFGHQNGPGLWQFAGMTLRDYFAAKAMQAAATNPVGAEGFTFHQRAEWAYNQADAMLDARMASTEPSLDKHQSLPEAKNTPTPWKRQAKTGANRWRIVDENGHQVADVNHYNADAEGNVEFILKAVNSHADLVHSLSLLISYMPSPLTDVDRARAHCVRSACAALDTACAA